MSGGQNHAILAGASIGEGLEMQFDAEGGDTA